MSDGFLSRWSRVKRGEVPAELPMSSPEEAAVSTQPDAPPEPAPAEVQEEEALDLSTLPDLDSATSETDFTLFLRKGVPEDLKNAALRRAWSLDGQIRDFVGPADYAWDFNAPDGVPGFALTLGGDIAKLVAQAIGQVERIAEELEGAEAPAFMPPGTVPPPTPLAEALPEPQTPLRLADAPAPALPAHVVEEPELAPPPRRRHGGALPS